jgi:hypothetical protein
MLAALIGAGVAPAQLKEIVGKEGRKLRPCPTCDQMLTTFPVRREMLHSCAQCSAMWVDDGALLRLGGIDPSKLAPEPLPTVQGSMLELATEGLPAAGPMKPFVEPRGAAAFANDDNPLGMFAPDPKPVVDDLPFVPEVGSFSERESSGTSFVSLGLKLGVAAIFLGGLYYAVTNAFEAGKPTDVGGGFEVLFWDQPVKVDSPPYNGATTKRYLSPWGTNTLEVIYIPGGGGNASDIGRNGKPEAAVHAFHGYTRMLGPPTGDDGYWYAELDFVDESDPFKTNKNVGGFCRYYFNDNDGWTVCGYSDSNIFAKSGKSMSFVASFRKKGSGKTKGGSGGASVPRSGAAVGVVGDTD